MCLAARFTLGCMHSTIIKHYHTSERYTTTTKQKTTYHKVYTNRFHAKFQQQNKKTGRVDTKLNKQNTKTNRVYTKLNQQNTKTNRVYTKLNKQNKTNKLSRYKAKQTKQDKEHFHKLHYYTHTLRDKSCEGGIISISFISETNSLYKKKTSQFMSCQTGTIKTS